MNFDQKYLNYQKKVNLALKDSFPKDNSRAAEAANYSLLAGGKRLRPIILLAFFEALTNQEPPAEIISLACSLEFAHTFSLIHDDLPAIDNDDLRRGRPTCHRQYDEATAILAGDFLLNLAYVNIAQANLDDFSKGAALTELSKAIKMLIMGEMRDIEGESRKFENDELELTYIQKTSSLFVAAFGLATAVLEQDEDADLLTAEALIIGQKLGLAFQVQDDVLNIIGDQAQMGKKTGSDIIANKQTWVQKYGLKKSQSFYLETYEEIIIKLKEILTENKATTFLLELMESLKKRQK